MRLFRLLAAAILPFLSAAALPNTLFINEIPDFTQTMMPGMDGSQLCAPVAASNALAWLTNNRQGQIDLIRKLSSKNYMDTSLDTGTSVRKFVRGLHAISKEMFGDKYVIEYQGWRQIRNNTYSSVKAPGMYWIAEGVTKNSAVWLNLGWYKFDKSANQYRRVGGHWVTLAGSSGDTLVIHDPSPRAGNAFQNNYVRYKKVIAGTLVGNEAGLPQDATNYYVLGEGFHMKSTADAAIIDGAIKLRVLN